VQRDNEAVTGRFDDCSRDEVKVVDTENPLYLTEKSRGIAS
jgi:hypothetical protein